MFKNQRTDYSFVKELKLNNRVVNVALGGLGLASYWFLRVKPAAQRVKPESKQGVNLAKLHTPHVDIKKPVGHSSVDD